MLWQPNDVGGLQRHVVGRAGGVGNDQFEWDSRMPDNREKKAPEAVWAVSRACDERERVNVDQSILALFVDLFPRQRNLLPLVRQILNPAL